jgi:DNA-binding response OmpR family regulator
LAKKKTEEEGEKMEEGNFHDHDDKQVYINDLKETFFTIHQTITRLKWTYFEKEKHVEDFYYTLIKLQHISAVFHEKELYDFSVFMLKQFEKEELEISIKQAREKNLIACLVRLLKVLYHQEDKSTLHMEDLSLVNAKEHEFHTAREAFFSICQMIAVRKGAYFTNAKQLKKLYRMLIRLRETSAAFQAKDLQDLSRFMLQQFDQKDAETAIKNGREKTMVTGLLTLLDLLDKQTASDQHREKQSLTFVVIDSDSPFPEVMYKELLEGEMRRFVYTEPVDLEEIAYINPDVIAVDMRLPQEQGYELIESIRKHETLADLPIVALSNESDEQHHLDFLSVGADYITYKPLTDVMLLGCAALTAKRADQQTKSAAALFARRQDERSSFENEHDMRKVLQEKAEGEKDTGKTRVLIMDDDRISTSLIMNHFSSDEWDVEVCIDVKHAVEKVLSFQPAFILCETKLKDLDGLFFCRQIRQIPQLDNVKFYFLTEQTLSQYVLRAYEEGADDYLTKPFSLEVLEAKMKRARMKGEGHVT